jgi:hypothetical protein
MLGKIGTCKAIKVADTSANGALLVEVVFAVTLRANVLVKRSATFAAMELAQNLNATKLGEVSVKAALAGRSLFVYLGIKFFNGELAVGVASKKADECFPARCFISLFSHLFSP